MPVSPKKNESQSDFVSRCVSIEMHANPDMDNKQAVAICHSVWRRSKGQKDESPKSSKEFKTAQAIKSAEEINRAFTDAESDDLVDLNEWQLRE